MDVNEKIKKLMKEKNWTEYRLAKESHLSQSTIINLFNRNTVPSVSTLESICKGFGITLSQFFAENEFNELNASQQTLFEKWKYLNERQKELVFEIIDNMK